MNFIITLTLASCLMLSGNAGLASAFAQPLDTLLHEAFRASPLLRSSRLQAEAAQHRALAATALPAPTLALEVQQVPVGNFNIVQNALSNNISLSQMFMFGEKRDAMQRVEEANAGSERERTRELAAALRAEFTTLYAKLWRTERQLAVYGRTVVMLTTMIEAAEQRFASRPAGNQGNASGGMASGGKSTASTTYSDILLLRAELAAEQVKFHGFTYDRKSTLARMNALLGRTNADQAITPALDSDMTNAIETLLARTYQAREHFAKLNPALRRLSGMERVTLAEQDAVQQERLPDVMLQGMLMRMPQGMTLTTGSPMITEIHGGTLNVGALRERTDWMYSLMASVTLPFAPWSVGRINERQTALGLQADAVREERESMRHTALADLTEQEQMLLHTIEAVKAYTTTILPLYRQALERQMTDFQSNGVSISEMLATARLLQMKEEEYAMALAEEHTIIAKLRMMLGDGDTLSTSTITTDSDE
jgi:outer membrane protein TolC